MDTQKPLKLKIKLPTRVQPEVMPEPGEAGLYTNKIHYMRKYLLDELVTKKFAMDFMEPVDTAALQVPNYYTIIKRPMDVGTIIKRVQNRFYHRVDDLIADFRLVISNCFTFNRPGDVVYRNCQKLEKFFHRVLNKMPKGEEKPSTKDPRSTGRQHGSEKASEIVQRQCQEHLGKLHASLAREDDQSIYKYFSTKFESLSHKVDRYYFKTIEEFRFEVTSIFKNFDNQINMFHELFHKTCDQNPHHRNIHCHWAVELEAKKQQDELDASVRLDKRDITEVLCALKRAESSVDHCLKSYSRERENCARSLIDILDAAASKLKQKLLRGRNGDRTREERRRELDEFYGQTREQSQDEDVQVMEEMKWSENELSVAPHSSDDERESLQSDLLDPISMDTQCCQPIDSQADEEMISAPTSSPMMSWQLPQAISPYKGWSQRIEVIEQNDVIMEEPPYASADTPTVVDSTLWTDLQLSSSEGSDLDDSSQDF